MIFDQAPVDRKVRVFSLSSSFIDQYEGHEPKWGYDGLGRFTYKRTYSRVLPDGTMEDWWQTCRRVVEGVYNIQKIHCRQFHLPWNEPKAQKSAQSMFKRMWAFKFLPPGRGLWMMGTDVVYERGSAALNSCGFASTENIDVDFAAPFTFLMDMSMLGVGVGGDTRGKGKVKLRLPKVTDEPFIVEDSREGWVELIRVVLQSFVGKGRFPRVIDFKDVRKRGKPLKTFGGTSSGPTPLVNLVINLARLLTPEGVELAFDVGDGEEEEGPVLLIDGVVGKVHPQRITSAQIVDIFNFIGKAVVAGGIRRCLPKGTLLHTSEGLVPIEDVKPGMSVVTSKGYAEVTDWVDQGKQNLVGITTQMGCFECTSKHSVAVISDIQGNYKWKRAAELEPGDRMVFVDHVVEGSPTTLPPYSYERPLHSTTCKDITVPDLDPELAWFFGLFHGDGYTTKTSGKGHVSITVAEDQRHFVPAIRTQFSRFAVNSGVVGPYPDDHCFRVQVSSKQLADYFSQFKQAKTPLEVPVFVLRGLPAVRAAYVAGLFDADGCSKGLLIAASSIYPEYLKQVQAVLASLGVPSRFQLAREEKGAWKSLYNLRIVGQKAIACWKRRVAHHSLKYEDTRKTARSQYDYGYPSEMALEGGISGHQDGKMVWSRTSRQITVSRLESITGQDVVLVPVEVLELKQSVREAQTYDISVKGAREFVAQGGYLVHNSSEIMFGDLEDTEFVTLKQDKVALEDRRWVSNNSVYGKIGMDYTKVAEAVAQNGEPGVFWLDNARAYSRMGDLPDHKDRRVLGTNPCFTGDTLIAVADGRGAVPIRQLAEEGIDIPVYSLTEAGKVEIQMGRHPRRTQESAPLVEVVLDDGSSLKVTPDHKMRLLDGTTCEAQELQPGDSLPRFTREHSEEGKRKTSQRAVTDLETFCVEERKFAVKICENCGDKFAVSWGKRERSYCSLFCGDKKASSVKARKKGQVLFFEDQQRQVLHEQVTTYKVLAETLGRCPFKTEWEAACTEKGTPVRMRTKGTTKNPHALTEYKHLQQVADGYNHRVAAVKAVAVAEPVYNVTVEHNHTVGVVTSQRNHNLSGVFTWQCGEQPLEDRELCNLVETFPAHHDSFEDYQKTLKMAYLYAKTVTLVPTHDPRANAVMMRNRRIGCSMSGIQQAIKTLGRRAFLTWCDRGYAYLKELDLMYSEWLCIPRSIKMSSIKPSGTVSLLAGATPGVHHAHSEFYIRNIRVKNTSPLIQAAQDAGYAVEPDVYADDTTVVSFPVKTPNFDRGKQEVSIWEQFADAAAMQKHWADNQVSCSISFSAHEAQHIVRCLEVYEDQLKAISLIPLKDHGYKQAPYIEISGVEYDRMVARLSPLNLDDAENEVIDQFCDGDKCMVKLSLK